MIPEIANQKPEADAGLVQYLLLMRKLSKITAFENQIELQVQRKNISSN